MTSMDIKDRLNLVQQSIASGNAILLLGPNTSVGAANMRGMSVPTIERFLDEYCEGKDIFSDASDLSQDDVIHYATRTPAERSRFETLIRESFSIRSHPETLRAITSIVWRRIYTFDQSDALELAYRRNPQRQQEPKIITLDTPISAMRTASNTVELVKLFGDALQERGQCFLNTPRYEQRNSASPWYKILSLDIELHPVIFCGEQGDGRFLLSKLRQINIGDSARDNIIFICPKLNRIQRKTLEEQSIVYIDLSFSEFSRSLLKIFPNGRSVDAILSETSHLSFSGNSRLEESILNSFFVLTNEKLSELSSVPQVLEHGIRRFYRGDSVTWSDIIDGIHADLTPYKNFRERIESEFRKGFPRSKLFLMTSPAGMGRTVGLMGTAIWLRNFSTLPVLWLLPDGDLKEFFISLNDDDFGNGAFVIIDDLTNYIDSFEGVPDEKISRFCFVSTSRETRWIRYKSRIPEFLDIKLEPVRALNRKDAESLHDKIARFGTLIYFDGASEKERIEEILQRSKKDLLVLIREIGLGKKFDQIVESEISDLNEHQTFAYFLICTTDRNQVSLPYDVFSLAFGSRFPGRDTTQVLESLGRLVARSTGGRSLTSRHSLIAARIIERSRSANPHVLREAVQALIGAFTNFRSPIIVHHSNTAHARVFKLVINNRFLSFCFGNVGAIEIYKRFEKPFEADAFFWQQFGLTYLRGKNFPLALETLRHALMIHDHFQIIHSLAAAGLQACAEIDPSSMGHKEFEELRRESIEMLETLHSQKQDTEDLPIATLVALNTRISYMYDSDEERYTLLRDYHAKLAFYLRDFPDMANARQEYNILNNTLSTGNGRLSRRFDTDLIDLMD